jgi:hypothetical protein
MALPKQMPSAEQLDALVDETLTKLIQELLPKCQHDFSSSSIQGHDFRTACRLFKELYGETNLKYYALLHEDFLDGPFRDKIQEQHSEVYQKTAKVVKAVFPQYT